MQLVLGARIYMMNLLKNSNAITQYEAAMSLRLNTGSWVRLDLDNGGIDAKLDR